MSYLISRNKFTSYGKCTLNSPTKMQWWNDRKCLHFQANSFHCSDEKQWKTQPDTTPVKTLVTPVTFSSSHYLIQHVQHTCSTSSPEDCEKLHIIHWNTEHHVPHIHHSSGIAYPLKNRLLCLEQRRKITVIDRPGQIFGLKCTTDIRLSVMQVDSSGKILDLRKFNINFDHMFHTTYSKG